MKYLSNGLVSSPAFSSGCVISYAKIGANASTSKTKEDSTETSKETSFTDTKGERTSQLKLDQAAIDKTVADLLSGTSGLASIFQAENAAGIFDSTGATAGAGDLAAKIAGEIAKLTGETVTSVDETARTETESERVKRLRGGTNSADAGFGIG